MKKKAFIFFFTIVITFTFAACSKNNSEQPSPKMSLETDTPAGNQLYNYDKIYSFHNAAADTIDFNALAALLQPKGLKLKEAKYTADDRVLRIDYELNITEKGQFYKVDYTKEAQDTIVLFALLDYLSGVEFNYVQNDYGFGGVPMKREEAEVIFCEDIAEYGKTEKAFTQKLPAQIEKVVYKPEIMDEIYYENVMGLDS